MYPLKNMWITCKPGEYAHKYSKAIDDQGFDYKSIDKLYAPYLSRDINDLDMVDKAILRMATYELKYMTDVPYKVVINEAIMLAKEFAAQDSHKFVNGVLDKYVKAVNLSE